MTDHVHALQRWASKFSEAVTCPLGIGPDPHDILAVLSDRQAVLDRAWADINALGGAPSTPEEEAYGRALDDCMAVLERLGATDTIWRAEF